MDQFKRAINSTKIKQRGKNILNLILDFIIETNVRFRNFIKTPFGKFTLACTLLLAIAVPLLLTVLGFDSIIIRSNLEGFVRDNDGEVIPNAIISIQDKRIETDSVGHFNIGDLDYGRWKIKIERDGYAAFEEEIVLERFRNTRDFNLIALDYGIVIGSFTNSNIEIDQLELLINDQSVNIKEDGSFESPRLIVGNYTLKFTSPFYKDFEQTIQVKNGTNNLDAINLEPAGDLIGKIVDYISLNELKDATIKVKGTNNNLEIQESGFIIKDIPVKSQVEISVELENYKTKEIGITIEQGDNSLDEIKLVPTGRITSNSLNTLIVSDFDGENILNISNNLGDCSFLMIVGDSIYMKCNNNIIRADANSGAAFLIFSSTLELTGITNALDFIEVNNSERSTLIINQGEIFRAQENSEDIITWISNHDGSMLYFSTTDGIYEYIVRGTEPPRKITNGIFYLKDIVGDELIALSAATSGGTTTNLWTIGFDGGKRRVTIFPKNYFDIKLITPDKVLATYIENGTKVLSFINLNNGSTSILMNAMDSVILNKTRNVLTVSFGNELYIFNSEGKSYQVK